MLRPALVACVVGPLLVTPGPLVAEDMSSADARRSSPFGSHGPQYSHWIHSRQPNLWLEGEARFRVLMDSGPGWARQDFWWGLVEPEQGTFVWDDFDRVVAAYERYGVNLLAILCYSSAWSGGVCPDTDDERARFANYVHQMVKRYKGRVAAWEIWNEPNILPFWSPRPDPELYTKLLQAAYTAAKKADPDCVIVGGAFAGPDHGFLKRMYECGAKGYFDVLSYHNYGQQNSIAAEWPAVERIRAVMAESGDAAKPIWHTETGFYTGSVGLSEQQQAARIVRYSVGLLALGIEKTFQLTLNDWSDDPKFHDQGSYRGLTHADYRLKRSYAAYRTMCQRLGDKRFVAAIRPAEGLSGYLFESDHETALVLWRKWGSQPKQVALNLGVPVVLVQQMEGDWQVHRNAAGAYTLPVGAEPVYIMKPGPPITNQRLVQWPNPVLTRIPRSADAIIEATVTNPGTEPLVLRLYPHRLASVRYESGEIPPGATTRVPVMFNASQLSVGRHELYWELTQRDADEPLAQGFRVADVESPLDLAFEPIARLRPGRPVLPVRVRYRGTRSTAGELALFLDGKPSGAALEVALSPGGSERYELPLELGPFESGRAVAVAVALRSRDLDLRIDSRRRLIPCLRAPKQAVVDGDLGEWRARPPQVRPGMMYWEYANTDQPPPPEDLNVSAWVNYDERGLWLAVEVRDDAFSFPQSHAVWNWDSLQVGLDLGSDARPDAGYDDNDLEVELGYKPGGPDWCYLGSCPPGWPQEELSARLKGVARPDNADGTVAYELLIPADVLLSSTSLAADTVVGFSIMVNDDDGDGRGGWLELTPGIGLGKRPFEFAWLWLR